MGKVSLTQRCLLMTRHNSVYLWVGVVLLSLSGCTTMPTGQAKVELIDELVAQQEFSRIEKLLQNIDTREEEFEALVVRRRAIRPLIAQFETNVIRETELLESADEWPQAEILLKNALGKLPESEALLQAKTAFYQKRDARLDAISQQIALIEGEFLSDVSPQLDKAVDIHPKGISTRWRQFWHERKVTQLANQMIECGQQAFAQTKFDLADACFTMAKTLGTSEPVDEYLVAINERRTDAEMQLLAEQKTRDAKKRATEKAKLAQLKLRYQQLVDAKWWSAARDTLAEMQVYGSGDQQVIAWAMELQVIIDRQVTNRIRQGQLLYSQGELKQALVVWQEAAELDPTNPTVLSHIARVERFLDKLDRLNQPTRAL